MKQINYFKFLEKYPEFIDVDDDISVKMALLRIIRKRYWRKKNNETAMLLPIKILSEHPDFVKNGYFQVKYRKCNIATIIFDNGKITSFFRHKFFPNVFKMMEKEEIINLKRLILMEEMLK